ncbi:MAG: DUF4198 domain-containing protein [Acidobacteriota bacterium]
MRSQSTTATTIPSCALWIVLVGLLALPARGHDMWITPIADAAVDAPVRIDVLVGHGGDSDPVRRSAERLVRFEAHGPSNAPPSTVAGIDGGLPMGVFRPDAPGPWIVGYVSTAVTHTMEPAKFDAYLVEEGLEAVRAQRRAQGTDDQPGTEWYSRSLKTLVSVGPDAAGAPADRAIGLPVELLLEKVDGGAVVVRLLVDGAPTADALVDLRRPASAEASAAGRTDAEGRLRLALGADAADAAAGPWVAATVHMVAEKTPEADWRTTFATLSFVLPPPSAGGGG